ITYWSLLDPLCQSQSLPYLLALAREGYRLGLVTFEQPRWRMPPDQQKAKQNELRAKGIEWRPLSYHKRPAVFSTLYDVGVGSLVAASLARRSRATVVHGRASVSSAIATVAAKLGGTRLFVDADGPLSQEYVDIGVWKKGSLGHRLTAWGERKSIEMADVVAVLTQHRRAEVSSWITDTPIHILPCAVDLQHFGPSPGDRERLRRDLGLEGTVFVYAGKAGGWYDTEGMVAFMETAKQVFGALTLLVLTREDPAPFAELCRQAEVDLVTRPVPSDQVPSYLSAGDVGLCFRHRSPSQLSCSPIKLAEYLACGVPVVATSGCGDYDHLIETQRVGIVIKSDDAESHLAAAREIERLLGEESVGERCRSTARHFLGLNEVVGPRYSEIYRSLCSPGD
ncbi:MAG: glycosyltransferase, partial [Alphaproteobacteria bacterium]